MMIVVVRSMTTALLLLFLFLLYLPTVLSYWPVLHNQPLNSHLLHSVSSVPLPERDLIQYDSYGGKQHMRWNADKGQFEESTSQQAVVSPPAARSHSRLHHFFAHCFFPFGDLSPDYYRYSFWRALQRLVSATNNVFGTQALLLALGFRKQANIGLAAATSWVLKDALGKFSRIVWASNFGRRFDVDAKKWRFRSALLYSTGNILEVVTYLFPASFLLFAACSTACKQMAMLTSSSTRNTVYKSFSRNADNIGDVTAKGEAQSAVIDLLGLSLGVTLSRVMNASNRKVVLVFALLIGLDLFCVYHEIRR